MKIYCDGACSGNPGPSGSGIAIYGDDKKPTLLYGAGEKVGTNNTAELRALLHALKIAKNSKADSIEILSDSKYGITCISSWAYGWKKRGWKKNDGEIKNLDLIKEAHALFDSISDKIVLKHVRGHNGVEGNELADRMAVHASRVRNETFVEFQYDSVATVLARK